MENIKKLNFIPFHHPSVVEAILIAAIEQGFPVSVSGRVYSPALSGGYRSDEKYLHFHFRDEGADIYQNGIALGYHTFSKFNGDIDYGKYNMGQNLTNFIEEFSALPAEQIIQNWVNAQIEKLEKNDKEFWVNIYYTRLIEALYKR
jgi:hypothetical protein